MILLRKLIDWLYKITGYCPQEAEIKFAEQLENVVNNYSDVVDRMSKIAQELIDANKKVKELQQQIDECALLDLIELNDRNIGLESENLRLQGEINESKEYYRKIEGELSDIMHNDKRFGFGQNMTFPGSTSLIGEKSGDSVLVYGRSVLLDTIAQQIQDTPSMTEKYSIAINYLIKNGLIEKLTRQLISQGAVQFTIGFNENNTSLEIYYALEAKVKENTLEFDKNDIMK